MSFLGDLFNSKPRFRPEPDDSQMDIDQPEPHPHGGFTQYTIPHDNNGPARKRLHSEMSTPSRPFKVNQNDGQSYFVAENTTPLLFHTAGLQIRPHAPTVPAVSAFQQFNSTNGSMDFGFGERVAPTSSYTDIVDVDMAEVDSPARPHAARIEVDLEPEQPANAEGRAETSEEVKIPDAGDSTQDGKSQASFNLGPRPISKGAIKRTQKRRQREFNQGPVKTEHTFNLNTNQKMRHSEIPALLIGYLQVFVNASVVFFVLYLAVQFVLTVRQDVKDKMAEASIDILQEVSECSQLYLTNRCDPSLRVPAMEAPCRAWEACMNRDPTMVGRTNVLAETFAGVINSFVDPISWKTMGFTLITLSFLIVLTNSALFNLRLRATPDLPPPPTPQQMFPPLQSSWMPGGPQQHQLGQGYPHHQYQQGAHPGQYGHDVDQTGTAPLRIEDGGGKGKKGWLW